VPYLGAALVAFAIAGPALWPWYLIWGFALLAAWPATQGSRLFVLALVLGAILVKPGGILALPLGSSPVVAVIWLGLAGLAAYRWRRGRLGTVTERPEGLSATRSALAER
jgi:hypothetical protein